MWDRTPALAADEQAAFAALSSWYKNGSRGSWPLAISKNLRRLTQPVCDELDWMHVASVPRNSSLRVMMMEMIQRRTSFWDWSDQDWIDVLKPSEGAFKLRNGCHGNCRQYVMALAYRLGRFDRLEEIGTFFQYRLAIKVFGREPVDVAASQVRHEMTALGFSEGGKRGLSQALHMALLYQRSARLEDIKIETLHRVLNSGPEHVRVGSAMLSRTLERMGIVEKGFCNRQDNRRRPANEYSAVEGVPPIWLDWCNRWRAMSTRAETSTTSTYYGILKCGRWLADVHPEILSPAQWNRGLALEYASVSARMAVGQWANPVGVARNRLGKPLKPSAVASHLRCIRDFFNDLHSWEWVPQKFSPAQTLRPSRTILARIGPDPRVIADDIWAKLIWAGINLTDGDLHQSAGQIRQPPSYPLSMVRASALLWLFGGYDGMKSIGCRLAAFGGQMITLALAINRLVFSICLPAKHPARLRNPSTLLRELPLRTGKKYAPHIRPCWTERPERWSTIYSFIRGDGLPPTTSIGGLFLSFAKKQVFLKRMLEVVLQAIAPVPQSRRNSSMQRIHYRYLNYKRGSDMPRRKRRNTTLL
jgi:hypothetical protein